MRSPRRLLRPALASLALALLLALAGRGAGAAPGSGPSRVRHLIVLYQENWSFDGLYAAFPGADGFPYGRDVPQADPQGEPIATMPFPTDDKDKPFTTNRWPDPMPVAFHKLEEFDSGKNKFT